MVQQLTVGTSRSRQWLRTQKWIIEGKPSEDSNKEREEDN